MTRTYGKTDELITLIEHEAIGLPKGTELDDLIDGIDSRLTFSCQLKASTAPDALLNIGLMETILADGRKIKLPLLSDFSGGTIDIQTGAITGDVAAFSLPSSAIGQYVQMGLELSEAGQISVSFNVPAATVGGAGEVAFSDGIKLGTISLENTDGATAWKGEGALTNVLENNDITQFLGGGGSGGGKLKIIKDEIEVSSGTSVVFPTLSYGIGKSNYYVFRNGNLMNGVDTFGTVLTDESFAQEYKEVGSGDSFEIELHADFPAGVDGLDLFELIVMENTFEGLGLAERTILDARLYGDGSGLEDCTWSEVSNKTRVTLTQWVYNAGLSTGPRSDIGVLVNGQKIEKLIVGVNDFDGEVLFEEAPNGNYVDVFLIDGTPTPIAAEVPIVVYKDQYRATQLDAIASHIIPAENGVYDIGSLANRIRDLFLTGDSIHIGTSSVLEGQIRWSTVDQKLQFKHMPTDSWSDFGTGGGGAGESNPLATLNDAELQNLDPQVANALLDTFNQTKGVVSNMERINSALRLEAGQNLGDYEVKRETSSILASAEAKVVASIHALAPKLVAGNVLTFEGDIQSAFPVASKVLFAKTLEQNGSTDHIYLQDTGDVPAHLVVASLALNTGDTEVTFTNPNALDLSLGLIQSELASQHKTLPWDYTLEASVTDNGGSAEYDLMELDQAHGLDVIRLEGSNFYQVIESLNGTIDKLDGTMSKNGQYGLIRVLENTQSPYDTYHWYYSTDRGNTWDKITGTKSTNTVGMVNEIGGLGQYLNPSQLGIANNGKFVSQYQYVTSTSQVRAVYGDITLPTPLLNDFPNIGDGVGVIRSDGSTDISATLGIDPIDCSFVSFGTSRADTQGGVVRNYKDFGATYDFGSSSTGNWDWDTPYRVFVTGTGTSHQVWGVKRSSATGALDGFWMDEGSAVLTGTTGESAGSGHIIDALINDTYMIVVRELNAAGFGIQYLEYGTTTVWTPQIELSSLAVSLDNGVGSVLIQSLWKSVEMRLKSNPNDDKHFFASIDMIQYSGQERISTLFEIKDITTLQGSVLEQTGDTLASPMNHRNNTGAEKDGQTFVPPVNVRLRTLALRMARVGEIDPNATITVEIQSTSGSAPEETPTTIFATSTINIAEAVRTISGTHRTEIYIPFDIDLVAGTTYFFQILASYPNDGSSGYVQMSRNTSGSGSGNAYIHNGTSWSILGVSDMYYEIRDHWASVVGLGESIIPGGVFDYWDCESSIELTDSNQMKLLFRRTYDGAGTDRSVQGHPFERTVNISNTVAQSTKTDIVSSAYDEISSTPNYDRDLVFNVALGSDSAKSKDLITGALNPIGIGSSSAIDRSLGAAYNSSTSMSEVIDSDFQEGKAISFNGSTTNVTYSDFKSHSIIYDTRPFIIEAEIKTNAIGGSPQDIVSKNGGWSFRIDATTGALNFIHGTMTNTITNDIPTPTDYHKVRVVGDGDSIKMYRSIGVALTAGPNGESVFTEAASYASQLTGGYAGGGAVITSNPLTIGKDANSSSEYFNGSIGYLKIAKGSASFAYHGYKSQPPVVSIQNMGSNLMLGKQNTGNNTSANGYYDAGVAKDGRPFADSYDAFLSYKLDAFTGTTGSKNKMAAKLSAARGGDEIQTSVQGIEVNFKK